MRNKRRVAALVVITAAAVLMAGGLVASNMGFKLNYPLFGTGEDCSGTGICTGNSVSGRQTIGLPYNRQVGIDFAQELLADVTAGGITANELGKYDTGSDTLNPYPGPPVPGNFALEAGRGYVIRTPATGGDYIIVGSHDPGFTVTLPSGDGASLAGREIYAHPYHGVAASASAFLAETTADSISAYNPASDTFDPYPGPPFPGDFALVPGASYLVRNISGPDIDFVPAHY